MPDQCRFDSATGKFGMPNFAVRKRRGQWTICSDENVLLNFNSYDEAIETARSAVGVLANRIEQPASGQKVSVLSRAGGGRGVCPGGRGDTNLLRLLREA